MARYALINSGKVTNIAVGDVVWAGLAAADNDEVLDLDAMETQPSIGWTYDNEIFAAPVIVIPQSVTPRQIRMALVLSGVSISQIDDALATMAEPEKSLAVIEWEYSTTFVRTNPLVAAVATMLEWTSGQLDALWALAYSL